MPETRIVKLERLVVNGGGRDRWFMRPGRVRGQWHWFSLAPLPDVEAREAYFELERIKGGWRVVRQVETPPGER